MLLITEYFISSFFCTIKDTLHMGKPYNPIIGEQFNCKWKHKDSITEYYSEQVSHHPPISTAYLINKEKKLRSSCTIEFKVNFLGNSAENVTTGKFCIDLIEFSESYLIEFPKIMVNGIVFGKSGIDNGGEFKITCKETNLVSNVSFHSSKQHKISGDITSIDKKNLFYKISGSMKEKVIIQNDDKKEESIEIFEKKVLKKFVENIENQKMNESRKLWYPVTDAIIKGDSDSALKFKSELEDQQRKFLKNETFESKLFKKTNEIVQGVSYYKFIHFDADNKIDSFDESRKDSC